ncbi:MAG: hypothetical protein P4L31_05295, partial [Candidatus Babeliales bacterium]|nr:hypothetical protein [Candidatus Babeliales bacterium]
MKHFYNFFWGVVVCLSMSSSTKLFAVIVGSNESVSVQSRITFPAADNDNSILSFAFMKNGISLEDASTTCTF